MLFFITKLRYFVINGKIKDMKMKYSRKKNFQKILENIRILCYSGFFPRFFFPLLFYNILRNLTVKLLFFDSKTQ